MLLLGMLLLQWWRRLLCRKGSNPQGRSWLNWQDRRKATQRLLQNVWQRNRGRCCSWRRRRGLHRDGHAACKRHRLDRLHWWRLLLLLLLLP
jgi:hypothetical protein